MDFQKYIRWTLLGVLTLLFVVLMIRWQDKYDNTPAPTQAATQAAQVGAAPNLSMGSASTTTVGGVSAPAVTPVKPSAQTITVTTDVMKATIDLQGGNVTSTQLLGYPEALNSKTPFTLLSNDADTFYVAQSGLLGTGLPSDATFTSDKTSYTLNPGDKKLTVNLTWEDHGVTLVKSYTFTEGKYNIEVYYHIANNSNQALQTRFYGQLLRTPVVEKDHTILSSYTTFTGAALSTPSNHYEKYSFANLGENNIQQSAQGGWIAMVQHYFISAWVPESVQVSQYYSQVYANNVYAVGISNPVITVPAHGYASTGATLYVGPAIAKELDAVAPNLSLTIDYGWFWFISKAIFAVMSWIHHFIPNWGVAIILVTILIKLIFYPLSAKSYRSMARMRKLQPKLKVLKEQCGDDRQKLGRATMELYRDEKVNPLSGCLPMIIQIPVFIALYWMLMESVELRQAPFIFWIHDLSQRDPYFVLPVLMGLSMFIQQRLNPAPPDPMQAKVMMFLPVIFTVMFLSFPAGLVLYWLVNNVVSVLQQWYVMRKVK